MRFPILQAKNRMTQTLEVFEGYNHIPRVPEGQFFDMENLTSDQYPLLSPRKKRGLVAKTERCGGLIAKDCLCRVEGSAFVLNDYRVELDLTEGEKQLVSMGAYVVIFPDKKYINTADLLDKGSLEAHFTTLTPVVFTLCRADGEAVEPDYHQTGEPEEAENGQLWLDISTTPHSLKQWSQTNAMWVTVPTTYVKIAAPGIGKAFSQWDGICLEGLTGTLTDDLSGEPIPDTTDLAALEGMTVVQAKGEDFLVVPGILERERTIRDRITVSRSVPTMDYVVERGNRLWGCRYGPDSSGTVVNEIYCSKLGDFKNWNCFSGISTDSYRVSLGSDGPFTGAAVYGGYPLFFKENCLHKVFGDVPANFGIQTTACRGVQRGCHRSLAMVGELLYYKARPGICAYDGALPTLVSQPLGQETYGEAVAGGHGGKYYVSMVEGQTGKNALFVLDTALGLWHREDTFRAAAFCSCREELYALEAGTGTLWAMLGSEGQREPDFSWMAETGPLGLEETGSKVISRLVLRMALYPGSRVQICIQYDSLGAWLPLCNLSGQELRSFSLPIRPRRCDHFRLRVTGTGEARLYSYTKVVSQGSDRI